MNNKKAIVCMSGGQDSTTCLFWAIDKYGKDNVEAIGFNYGQKHSLELSCAKEICDKQGVSYTVLDMSLLNQLSPNSLTRKDIEVDEYGKAKEGDVPNSFVDGRNMVFLTFVAIYAKQKGISDIVTGVCQTDFSGYYDCRNVFIQSLNVSLNLAMGYEFVIHTPLMWIDKKSTWKLADELGVLDIIKNETLTCYNGIKGNGCGKCPACALRKKGYLEYKYGSK